MKINIIYVLIFVAVILVAMRQFHRRINDFKRRCQCGWHTKRSFRIWMPWEEKQAYISWRSPQGKLRFYVRGNVCKLTFSQCTNPACTEPRRFIKIDRDPVSVFHLKWTRRFDPEQFNFDFNDSLLYQAFARESIRPNFGRNKPDSPELSRLEPPPLVVFGIPLDPDATEKKENHNNGH